MKYFVNDILVNCYKLSFFRNPFKGNIINQPNGPNVYPGVLIDYTKKVDI